ncbi:helix-turn-helix domain-containing protein, partial [Streptomyces sp. NPDC059349]|uniref:helix-turn-helix domain-containing protein n=1 Tax=Streptomyces sp. NPDC059349 TaxID=3346808 RepID=UPI00367E3007
MLLSPVNTRWRACTKEVPSRAGHDRDAASIGVGGAGAVERGKRVNTDRFSRIFDVLDALAGQPEGMRLTEISQA